ncbi:MAG: phosphodiester glycosidase family protein [Spirochaetales bacterium]
MKDVYKIIGDEIKISKVFDESSSCGYIFTVIKKCINEKLIICPKVELTYNELQPPTSLLNFCKVNNRLFAINAGIFNVETLKPECVLILNSNIIIDQAETYKRTRNDEGDDKRTELYNLAIDKNGDMKAYAPSFSAKDIINDGGVYAVTGFVPLIIDGRIFKDANKIYHYGSVVKKSRQVIGQLQNLNYFVLTCEYPGMTLEEIRRILIKADVKFAYNLDGGKSTQTVFRKELLTYPYVGDTGRQIPTIITFNYKYMDEN